MTATLGIREKEELDAIAHEIARAQNVVQIGLAPIARIEVDNVTFTPRALEQVLRVFAAEWKRAGRTADLGATTGALRRRVIAFLSALRAAIAARLGTEELERLSPPRLTRMQR